MFRAYRGKDSRYAMEQNVGPTKAGDQESGWLYSQTNSLRQLGAKLTYSGDSPFLLRLVIGVFNEQSSDTVSWLPLYVSNDTTDFHPLTCEPGKRTELNVPFRKELPKTPLFSIDDIRCNCPDATHMIIRSVERNLRTMTQKITDDMHPHEKFAIQRFEKNLTRRGAKKPFFHFDRRIHRQSWQSGCSLSFWNLCADCLR